MTILSLLTELLVDEKDATAAHEAKEDGTKHHAGKRHLALRLEDDEVDHGRPADDGQHDAEDPSSRRGITPIVAHPELLSNSTLGRDLVCVILVLLSRIWYNGRV